jgi:basic membrane protein A
MPYSVTQDGAFGYNAAQALNNKYGHEINFRDIVSIPDIEATLREYADAGYDLIIAQGFEWGRPAVELGKDYPNTKFVVFMGFTNSTNVASIFPMQKEGSTGRTCGNDVKNRYNWLCRWTEISKPDKHI